MTAKKRKSYTLSCEIKGLKFEAEGERSEVLAKLGEFVQQHVLGKIKGTGRPGKGGFAAGEAKSSKKARGVMEAIKTIHIYAVNDCDWVAAESVESATAYYCELFGPSSRESIDEPCAVTEYQMQNLRFCDDDGTRRTFAEELQRRIAAGVKFPDFFASTEY